MNYRNPQLRDKLAAEYVLGTLTGAVRRRFAQLMKYDLDLRRAVSAWEMRLTPLAAVVPPVTPPSRVWRAIAARIENRRATHNGWRVLAAASTALVLVLAVLLVARQPEAEMVSTIAVLADDKSKPAMVVSWPSQNASLRQHLRIRMVAAPALPPGKSFELWMVPGGTAAPVSLGVIRTDTTQTIELNAAASKLLPQIAALAISVEPAGGSTTGLPTGPVILSGPCVRVI